MSQIRVASPKRQRRPSASVTSGASGVRDSTDRGLLVAIAVLCVIGIGIASYLTYVHGSEGSHHARVARFLRDHEVEVVVAHHMGDGMRRMLEKMGLTVRLGEAGSARESATTSVGVDPDDGFPPRL